MFDFPGSSHIEFEKDIIKCQKEDAIYDEALTRNENLPSNGVD